MWIGRVVCGEGVFFMVRGECVVSCECRVHEVCFFNDSQAWEFTQGFP